MLEAIRKRAGSLVVKILFLILVLAAAPIGRRRSVM